MYTPKHCNTHSSLNIHQIKDTVFVSLLLITQTSSYSIKSHTHYGLNTIPGLVE